MFLFDEFNFILLEWVFFLEITKLCTAWRSPYFSIHYLVTHSASIFLNYFFKLFDSLFRKDWWYTSSTTIISSECIAIWLGKSHLFSISWWDKLFSNSSNITFSLRTNQFHLLNIFFYFSFICTAFLLINSNFCLQSIKKLNFLCHLPSCFRDSDFCNFSDAVNAGYRE